MDGDAEPTVVRARLSKIALDGGRVKVPLADWPTANPPAPGERAVLLDDGLSKAAVVVGVEGDETVLVDVLGDRVRALRARSPHE